MGRECFRKSKMTKLHPYQQTPPLPIRYQHCRITTMSATTGLASSLPMIVEPLMPTEEPPLPATRPPLLVVEPPLMVIGPPMMVVEPPPIVVKPPLTAVM